MLAPAGGQDRPLGAAVRLLLLGHGGSANVAAWARALALQGAEVHFASFRHRFELPCVLHRLPALRALGKARYLFAAPWVRRLISAVRPQVVVAYYATGYGLLGALTGFRPRVVVVAGDDVLITPTRSALVRRLLRHTLGGAELVVSWAPHLTESVDTLTAGSARTLTLPRGIDPGIFTPRAPSEADEAPRIVCTRALHPEYRLGDCIEVVGCLRKAGLDASLTVAGEGPCRSELEASVERLGLEGVVQFAGWVPPADIPALLSRHSVYLTLSPSDGASASLLEAMAAGLLPVVPDNPANRCWIRSGENGVLLGSLEPGRVADALWTAWGDAGLRAMAREENPRTIAERADIAKNTRTFLDAFRALAASSAARG